MKTNKLQINNLFFNGYFKLNKKRKPNASFIEKKLTDNPFRISFEKNTFTFKVSKNIHDFLLDNNLCCLLRAQIEDVIENKGKVDVIAARLLNYQATLTLFKCKKNFFLTDILLPFCKHMQIKQIGISQDASSSIEGKIPVEEIPHLKNFTYILLEITNRFYVQKDITMKFQFNPREEQIHLSLIATYFDHFVKRIFSIWDEWGKQFSNPVQDSTWFVTDRDRRIRKKTT